jgi:N-acetylmuramic acid 6-phosphate etherase
MEGVMRQINLDTLKIDEVSTLEMLKMFNKEDEKVAGAVKKSLTKVATAVDMAVACIKRGGRLIYMGSGTSGKIAVMDASECPPTFGVNDEMVMGIISGGEQALSGWLEATEDDQEMAVRDLEKIGFCARDMLLGVSASGTTPYVLAGLNFARGLGSRTVALCSQPQNVMEQYADVCICVDVGPEAIMGSSRLKAGTAQKMVLNMLSSAVMIHLGKTYGNLMVDVRPINKKLQQRVVDIVQLSTGKKETEILDALAAAGGNAKRAILMLLLDINGDKAQQLLDQHGGVLKKAVKGERCESDR